MASSNLNAAAKNVICGMGIQAVIFDMDGVLVDSVNAWYDTERLIFKEYANKDISFQEWKKDVWGKDTEEVCRMLHLDAETTKKVVEWQDRQIYQSIGKIKPMEAAKPILENMKAVGIKIGVLSNNRKAFIEDILKTFSFYEFFDSIVGDEIEPKPSPKGLLKSLENLGTPKEKVVFVGDTQTDLNAGNAAGIKTLIVGKDAKTLSGIAALILS